MKLRTVEDVSKAPIIFVHVRRMHWLEPAQKD